MTPTLTSAHRRKSLYEVPFPASQRQPALARLLLGTLLGNEPWQSMSAMCKHEHPGTR
jgi:hypothetical protein